MKALRSRKLAALALAVVLLAGMLPVGASAQNSCQGKHQPGKDLYPANWNSQTGGYGYDYYLCTVCGAACHANGISAQFVDPTNGCSGGYKCHVPNLNDPYVTACNRDTNFYYCQACKKVVDTAGTIADVSTLGGHTPDMSSEKPADHKPCVGGYQSPYYICTKCQSPCKANGSGAPYTQGTGIHKPGSTQHPANWNSNDGGYKVAYYTCVYCDQACDIYGNLETFVGPGNACAAGHHTPKMDEKRDADYTICNGGFECEWYECTQCHEPCDANGNLLVRKAGTGTHTLSEKRDADYTPCGGGYQSDWYECAVCRQSFDDAGNTVEWQPGTGTHTRGTEEFLADYTPCLGGFQTTHYECIYCHCPLDAEGNVINPVEGTGKHTPGDQHESNYTPCDGGFKGEWYECKVCGQPCVANGDEAVWEGPEAPHKMIERPEQAPTYELEGHRAYWECEVCHRIFHDPAGTQEIGDWEEIILRLTMETTVDDLETVPETVAAKYPKVEDIHNALLEKALSGNSAMKKENTNSVLLDVSLQIRNADNELVPVDPNNFPEEGVEVLLPYPEGANRTYTFVITHMITSGEHAGEIEVLSYQAEADGLLVRFTSMSPVCIAYQAGSSSTITIIAGDTTAESASNPTTGAAGGQALPALLLGGVLVMALSVPKKRK